MNRDHSFAMADIQELARLTKREGFDAMVLDPLVSLHHEEENDNTAMGEVMDALKDVRLLRLDVTADNAASRELLGRYKVPGPPSFVWIGPDGEERRAQRITGEVDAAAFLQRWTQTRDAL